MKAIFNYYKHDKEMDAYQCNNCEAQIKTYQLGNMEKHLERKHNELYKKYLPEKSMEREEKLSEGPGGPPAKKICLQPKIEDSLSGTIRIKMTSNTLISGLRELVTVNGRAFSIVNDSGLRKIIDPILEALPGNLVVNMDNIKKKVHEKAEEIKKEISNDSKDKLVSLKIDGVKARGRCFVGINLQYINESSNGLKIVIRNLCTLEVFQSQTGKYLKESVLKVLKIFDIDPLNIYSIANDNGRNMVKAAKLLKKNTERLRQKNKALIDNDGHNLNDFPTESEESESESDESEEEDEDKDKGQKHATDPKSKTDESKNESDIEAEIEKAVEEMASANNWLTGVKCMVHTLQLAVEDALEDEAEILNEARNIVKRLRTATVRNLLKKDNIKHSPLIDHSVRWCSKFLMLRRLLKFEDFCKSLSDSDNRLYASDETWNKIKKMVEVLKPPARATKTLQREQLTPSDGYLAWFTCEIELGEINDPLAERIKSNMISRCTALMPNEALLGALFLDPRFHVTLKDYQVKAAKKHLSDLHDRLDIMKGQKNVTNVSNAQKERETVTDEQPGTSGSAEKVSSVQAELQKRAKKIKRKPPQMARIKSILNSFSPDLELDHKNFNILEYWFSQRLKHPELYELAKVVFSSPVTQVSVERLFSNVAYILNHLRSRMTEMLLNDTILVRMWFRNCSSGH